MRTRTPLGRTSLRLALGGLVAAGLGLPGLAQETPFNASQVSRFDQSGSSYADVWGDGDFDYIARFGQNEIDIIDISNPGSPTLADNVTVPNPNSSASAQDVKVGDDLMFVALESGGNDGVAIYDVRNPFNAILRTLVDPEPGSYEFIHNVFYDNGWLYMSNSSDNTVAIVDLRTYNPDAAPSSITSWDYRLQNVANTFVHDITVVDGYLYCSGWDAMWVYDVSNLGSQAPVLVGTEEGFNSHAVWSTDDSTWCVTVEEREGGAVRLYEIDINGGSMNLIPRDSWTPTSGSAFSGHNAVIDGDRVYVSCYQKGGIVFEIESATKSWELVASFDTSTSSPSGFTGNWGIYPYLGADRVLLSDISNGLYVIDYSALEIDFTAALPRTIGTTGSEAIDVTISGLGTSSLNTGTPTLYTRINGSSFTGTPMSNTGSSWTANLPVASGGAKIDYYVEASYLGGTVWRDPINAPSTFHTTYATASTTQVFFDDFSTAQGWSTSSTASTGQWERVNPNPSGAAPEDDDPNGTDSFCYVTDQGSVGGSDGAADIDNGQVTLTSPNLDFSAGDGLISWASWFFNDDADGADELIVQLSDDGGTSWTTVSTTEIRAGGWVDTTVRVSDFVAPTSQVRARFLADDSGDGSVTEAAVDTFLADVFDDDDGGGGGGTDATVTSRNGSGVNPDVFSTVTLPIIGTNWDTTIDATGGGATGGLTFVVCYNDPITLPTAFGELLVDVTSPFVNFTTSVVIGGSSAHSSPIPADNTLIGFTFSCQSFLNQNGQLTNALDVLVGDQ